MSLPRSLQARIDLRSDTVTLPPPGMLEAIPRAALGVAVGELGRGRIRAVTHFGITAQDVDAAVGAVRQLMGRPADLSMTAREGVAC